MVTYRYSNYMSQSDTLQRPVSFLRKATPGDVFIHDETPLVVEYIDHSTDYPSMVVESHNQDNNERFLLSADSTNNGIKLNGEIITDLFLIRQLDCKHCGGSTEFVHLINHSISGVQCTECGFVQTIVYHDTPTVVDPDIPTTQ